MWTYRIKYAKRGRIRFTSHLDVLRALVRGLYRARLPLAYTEGFNPHPKITLGPALPLGYESEAELADIVLTDRLRPESVQEMLKDVLPEGLELLATEPVSPSTPRLSHASSAVYMVELKREQSENIARYLEEFAEKASAPVERVRKDMSDIIDVKHFVKELGVEPRADCRCLRMEIFMGDQGSCSAAEMVRAVLHLPPDEAKCLRIVRTEIRFGDRPLRKSIDAKEQEEDVKQEEKPERISP